MRTKRVRSAFIRSARQLAAGGPRLVTGCWNTAKIGSVTLGDFVVGSGETARWVDVDVDVDADIGGHAAPRCMRCGDLATWRAATTMGMGAPSHAMLKSVAVRNRCRSSGPHVTGTRPDLIADFGITSCHGSVI
ncbi:hypothetical protein AXG93_2482s1070 [Marchantia polymorpha subsp. ruderalis]|uniref:Uncharacterized protein n=1 Tax=Marchantia polymorpha subsp. ruderalis TaxID=1480154 RepID=A0A176VC25_MARPO|nr:hypothetical protein AXG93_2482s1070 [Marchantia polymorpha subsp. ruderalis]